MTNAVQEMPIYSGSNSKVTWKQQQQQAEPSSRPHRTRKARIRGLLMSEAGSCPSRKLTDSGRRARKADLQPRPPGGDPGLLEGAQSPEYSQNEQRNVIRSRARRRRPWEASPFLSVNTVSPDKAVIDGDPEPAPATGRGQRKSVRPVQKERKLSARNQPSNGQQLRSQTPRVFSRCSSRGTPFDFYSFYTHKSNRSGRPHGGNHGSWMHQNPSFITGSPNLWSMGNKFWPGSGTPLEKHRNVVPSIAAIESSSLYPNQQVKHPFKHADSSDPLPERPSAPDLELKIQTANAICLVSKSLAAERDLPTTKRSGRLLKARLKPLHTFTPVGPTVNQCAGVQPEKRPQSPSQLKLQMRKKQLLDMLPPGMFQERPATRESVHRTSVVSNLSDDREHDFDGVAFQSEASQVPQKSVASFGDEYNQSMLLGQIDIPADPEMEEQLMQYMSMQSPNKTLSRLGLDGSAGDSMASFSDVLIGGAAGMIDSALTKGRHRRKPVEDKVNFTQKSILKTSKASAENIFSGLVWNGNSLERVQTAPEQGTQNLFGDETFEIDAERPVTAPDQPNILEAVAKQHLEKLLEEEDEAAIQENDVSDVASPADQRLEEKHVKFQNKPKIQTVDSDISDTAGDSQKPKETSVPIVEETEENNSNDITSYLINECEINNQTEGSEMKEKQLTNIPSIEVTENTDNPSEKLGPENEHYSIQVAHKHGDYNENCILKEHITSNVITENASQSNNSISHDNKIESFKTDIDASDDVALIKSSDINASNLELDQNKIDAKATDISSNTEQNAEPDRNFNFLNGDLLANPLIEELTRDVMKLALQDIKDSKDLSKNKDGFEHSIEENGKSEDETVVEHLNRADTQISHFSYGECSKDMKVAIEADDSVRRTETHQVNSANDIHSLSVEKQNYVAKGDAKEINILCNDILEEKDMFTGSRQMSDSQECEDRKEYSSNILPFTETHSDQLTDTFKPIEFQDQDSIRDDELNSKTEEILDLEKGTTCSLTRVLENLPDIVQSLIPETPTEEPINSNSEVKVPDSMNISDCSEQKPEVANKVIEIFPDGRANRVDSPTPSRSEEPVVDKLPADNKDSNNKSEWMFLTEDECSSSKTSIIPNDTELSAELCAKDDVLKESATLADADADQVIKKTQLDGEKEEEDDDGGVDDDDEKKEDETEDAADDDKTNTNEDDNNDDSGSGSAGGTGPQGPSGGENPDQAPDNQNNGSSGTNYSNSEPISGPSQGNSLSTAVNQNSTSSSSNADTSDPFVQSKMSDIDLEYSDIPEIDESVIFCGICGLDEDTCICPRSKAGGCKDQIFQSLTRIDSGYTGSIASCSDKSLEVMEPANECWSPRQDLQMTDEATDLILMYRNMYDNESESSDSLSSSACFSETLVSLQSTYGAKSLLVKGQVISQTNHAVDVESGCIDGTPVNNDVASTAAETDGKDSSSGKKVILNEAVSVTDLDDPNSLLVVAESKQISKTRSKVDKASPIAPLPPVCFRINARPPPDHVYYFAYGENMNQNRVSLYIGRQDVQRLWGLLFGFQIKFNKKGSDAAAGVFANIESNPENSVEGCVYLITKEELKRLDKYTGCPQFFSRVMFPVWMINSNDPDALGVAQYCIPAVMYIANDKWTTADNTLTSEYSVQQCLRGSELLTPLYVEHIAGCARS